MNRQLRRHANRDERRGIDRTKRIVPLPALLDEFTIFDIPQTILDRIRAGYIEAANNLPIFRDNEGAWNAVCPALSGWIFTWQRISNELKLGLILEPLRRINRKLDLGMPISEAHVQAAQEALDKTRQAFRGNDRKEITSIAKTAQIILLNGTEEKLNDSHI
ncbi:MAG TPA: hypothetical protein VK974_04860 [Methylophilaceae bacterium]|nr:hypothetical protein [Methylophilaceae bacterium]